MIARSPINWEPAILKNNSYAGKHRVPKKINKPIRYLLT